MTLERARELLGAAGDRLSDAEILRRCEALENLARMALDVVREERRADLRREAA